MTDERCQGGCRKVGLPLFGVTFPGEVEVQLCATCAAERIREGRHTGATFTVPNQPDGNEPCGVCDGRGCDDPEGCP